MIVEHTFVTTLDDTEAFHATDQLLVPLGFAPVPAARAPDAPPAPCREWLRGVANPRKAKRPTQFPQRLRLDFDRGRVTLAYAITGRHPTRVPKPLRHYALALGAGLDATLTGARDSGAVLAELQSLGASIDRRARRAQLIVTTIGFAFLGAVFTMIVLVVTGAF